MRLSPLTRQVGIRLIEEALEKGAADIRPGDAKPPVGSGQQATSLGQVVKQLQERGPKPQIQEENQPRVLTPQQ